MNSMPIKRRFTVIYKDTSGRCESKELTVSKTFGSPESARAFWIAVQRDGCFMLSSCPQIDYSPRQRYSNSERDRMVVMSGGYSIFRVRGKSENIS